MEAERLNYSVAICALARDCESALIHNIPKIEALRKHFRDSAVIVVENDSVDETKAVLDQWSNSSKHITIISQDFNTTTIPSQSSSNLYPGTSLYRIEKMASYRNIYLDWIERQTAKFDLIIMVDIDVLSFSEDEILNTINLAPSNWGGIFANGYTDTKFADCSVYSMFHDMYAYSENLPAKKPYITYGKLFELKKQMNRKLSKQKFLKVISAFGGFAIYKSCAITGLRYGAYANGDIYMEALCEHIMFNNEVTKRGYDCYIDRDLKVYYGKSEFIIVIRNLLPLWAFKTLCLLFKFRRLKE